MSAETRIIEIVDGALANVGLVPLACSGSEGISELFRFELTLQLEGDQDALKASELIGKSTTIKLLSEAADADPRIINGCISEIDCSSGQSEKLEYNITLVPELWKSSLSKKTKTHVYKQAKLDDICMGLIKELEPDVKVKNLTKFSGQVNFFDIQYNVTDLAFLLRLLTQFGISFFFEHAEGSHSLVLFNTDAGLSKRSGDLGYNLGTLLVDAEALSGWSEQVSAYMGESTANDFDLATVKLKKEQKPASEALPEFKTVKGNRYAKGIVSGAENSTETYSLANEKDQAQIDVERGQTSFNVISFIGNTPNILPGQKITLKEAAPNDETNFIVDSVQHNAYSSFESGTHYQCTINVLPDAQPIRPPEMVRQPLYSQLTAVVTKSQYNGGEKPDFATVRVSFPWDADKETFWIPVSQSFGGDSTGKSGALFLPQVDDTVLITFMNGDTRRPVVSGIIYNGKHKTPVFDKKNPQGLRMGFKAPSGSEWSMSEKSGEEEVYFRSSKDMNTMVDNHDNKEVLNCQTLKVSKDQTTEINNDQMLTVDSNQTIEVKKEQKLTVHKDQKNEIKSNQETKVSKESKLDAGKKIELKVGGNTVTIDTAKIELKGPTSSVTIDASGITLKTNGMVNVDGTQITAKSKAMTEVSSSGITQVKGSMVMIN